tara:strand:- start:577 stop:1233 length:657 start_codon:yes stop_codon:yes gene_type:complete
MATTVKKERVTVHNVMDFVTVKTGKKRIREEEYKAVEFIWDLDDEETNTIMSNDYRSDFAKNNPKCCLWVEKVKKAAKWKEGEELKINTKQNSNGSFLALWYKENDANFDTMNCDVTVESSGYVVMITRNLYECEGQHNIFKLRVKSVYNDNIRRDQKIEQGKEIYQKLEDGEIDCKTAHKSLTGTFRDCVYNDHIRHDKEIEDYGIAETKSDTESVT